MMECPLCGHHKTHKHGKTSKGNQRHYCPVCRQTFTETFDDTLYYRRQIEPEKIRTVLQAHAEGSSLRGVSRTTNLAYNTVVNLVRAASVKGQIVHNARLQQIETTQISGDEFWSFVQKNKNTVSRKI
jgi:transposase-like protein